jgi:hypothetical protein
MLVLWPRAATDAATSSTVSSPYTPLHSTSAATSRTAVGAPRSACAPSMSSARRLGISLSDRVRGRNAAWRPMASTATAETANVTALRRIAVAGSASASTTAPSAGPATTAP